MTIPEKLAQLKQELHQVIVGNDAVMDLLFISLLQKGHVLLESVPGTGKTVLANAMAQAIGGDFKRIQFSPDVLPSDIVGMSIYHPERKEFEFKMGPVDTNLLLADEINRATPRTQSALLEVMEEKQVTMDGVTYPLSEPFMILATQNPIESKQGTFDLPEAQMDRFFIKIDLGYPESADEVHMLQLHQANSRPAAIAPVFTLAEIREFQAASDAIVVGDTVKAYIVAIAQATREHDYVELGLSPRGSLALMRGAIGRAMIDGREYVTPDDVKYMAPYVIGHRLVLTIDGVALSSPAQVVADVLQSVEVPVEYGVSRDAV